LRRAKASAGKSVRDVSFRASPARLKRRGGPRGIRTIAIVQADVQAVDRLGVGGQDLGLEVVFQGWLDDIHGAVRGAGGLNDDRGCRSGLAEGDAESREPKAVSEGGELHDC